MASDRAVGVMIRLDNVAYYQMEVEAQDQEEEKQGIRYDGGDVHVRDDDEADEYVLRGYVGVHVGKDEEDAYEVDVYAE